MEEAIPEVLTDEQTLAEREGARYISGEGSKSACGLMTEQQVKG